MGHAQERCSTNQNNITGELKMISKFKVTYIEAKTTRKPPKEHTVKVEAHSKYNAKQRFYVMYPLCEVIKVEEVDQND